MPWRFLVDEDTDTHSATELEARGLEAQNVSDVIDKGHPDPKVAECARREDRILVTTDRDFLDPELRGEIRVFMVSDASATGHEIAERVSEIVCIADSPRDLRLVTWI